MTDNPDDGEAPGVDAACADRETLHVVAREVADNARDVDALEKRLDTVAAALAELVDSRRAELTDRIDAERDDTEAADTDAAADSQENRPRGYW